MSTNFFEIYRLRDLLGALPLRPQKQSGNDMMKKKIRKFRLDDLQDEELKEYLVTNQMNFTNFIHSVIQREIRLNDVTVLLPKNFRPELIKKKTIINIMERYQKTDPDLLRQLSGIGNNINQIARALNAIQHGHIDQQKQLNLFELFLILESSHNKLSEILPSLPKISKQSPDKLKETLISLGD